MIDRSRLGNSFEFVVLAGARARQLLAGSTPRVAVDDHKKTTIAQQEIMTRVVERLDPDEIELDKVETVEPEPSGE